jgi:hypothetical protein
MNGCRRRLAATATAPSGPRWRPGRRLRWRGAIRQPANDGWRPIATTTQPAKEAP